MKISRRRLRTGSPPAEKLQIVDLVRTFSILSVLALHLKPTLPLPSPIFRWGWDHLQRNGAYGVTIFFVISGFLITRLIDRQAGGLLKPDLKTFYVRRAARIFPLLLLVIALGVLLTYGFDDSSKKFHYCFKNESISLGPFFWASLVTFSYNWYQVLNPLSYPGIYWAALWSLSIEEQFYLFYPFILKGIHSPKKLVPFFYVVIGLGFLWRWGIYASGAAGSAPSLRSSFGAFDQIAFGALLYLTAKKNRPYLQKNINLSFFLCLLGFLITFFTYKNTFTGDSPDLVYGPFFIAGGVFLFLLGGLHLSFFESNYLKPLSLPGKYSYGNYLFNALVLFFIHPYLVDKNILVAFLIFVSATTCLAALSFHFFETPANHRIREFFGLAKN